MRFSALLTVATTITLTWASPVDIVARTTGSCAGSQVATCCNQVTTANGLLAGLLGVDLGALLGFSCGPLTSKYKLPTPVKTNSLYICGESC